MKFKAWLIACYSLDYQDYTTLPDEEKASLKDEHRRFFPGWRSMAEDEGEEVDERERLKYAVSLRIG